MKMLRPLAFHIVAATAILGGWIVLPGSAGAVGVIFRDTVPTRVIARVAAVCSSALAADLDFGTFTDTKTNIDATGTLTITCTNGAVYALTANYGANASGTQRRMKVASGTTTMNYEIYTTSARTTSFPATGTTQTYTGSGGSQSVSVYGRIPVQTVTDPGAFSDVLTWTLSY